MFKHVLIWLLSFFFFLLPSAFTGIIHIPSDTTSIQGGIHLASEGDTVLVANGTYLENINFKGKAITVASLFITDGDTNHINNTIIDGSQPNHPDSGSVVRFVSAEDSTSILYGFTITGGSGDKIYYPSYNIYLVQGGGINIYESGAKIIRNKIVNNSIHDTPGNYGKGGGGLAVTMVECGSKFTFIENNEIFSNSIVDDFPIGGGVWGAGYNVNHLIIIKSNKILNNIITCTSGWKAMGGGIGLESPLPSNGMMVVRNNLVSKNEARGVKSFGGGIYVVYEDNSISTVDQNPNTFIYNNLITNNYSEYIGGGISVWRYPGVVGPPPNSGSGIIPQPAIINNTIVNNSASDGYGIFTMNQVPLLLNNILWNKGSTPSGSEIYKGNVGTPWGLWANPYGDIKLFNSIVRGSEWSNINQGVFDIEPMFSDSLYHPSLISPCVGLGRSSIMLDTTNYMAPQTDIEGNLRPCIVDSLVDIGAYETIFPCKVHPTTLNLFYENTPYFNPVSDSVVVTSHIINPHTNSIQVFGRLTSFDSSRVDSAELFDDGFHHDGQAGDGLYGGVYNPLGFEAEFTMSIKVNDYSNGDHFIFKDKQELTTIGPLVYEGISDFAIDPTSPPMPKFGFKLLVQNLGQIAIAKSISVEIVIEDTNFVKFIENSTQNFGDINPGESVLSPNWYVFYIDSIPQIIDLDYRINIFSHGNLYWQDSVDLVVGIEETPITIPKYYRLSQNYPNPFNPSTTIEFDLPKTREVTLKVFNILGEEIATLVSDRLSAGSYSYEWDASKLASGVYLYRLQAGDPSQSAGQGYVETRKMILMR